ncbi:hypothetical protein RHMOL_Rhmol02G0248700 [Rhododendron molle]|uniref:Uncharacterized protein n=2 Tax=Rhododendron molle TaxID=49168 RepID=A0ACC0PTI4_RHOML|nr:hypothetical protein RHMOL_Rhmol02G0248700 [Rhododendron molle]
MDKFGEVNKRKYVRPGTAPMPGSVPVGLVGAPGQVHPPVNMGPVAGFGRGDWRSTGIRNAFPMQKNLQPGSGMNVWGNNTAGRGFGSGLDFTLPSHRSSCTVFHPIGGLPP